MEPQAKRRLLLGILIVAAVLVIGGLIVLAIILLTKKKAATPPAKPPAPARGRCCEANGHCHDNVLQADCHDAASWGQGLSCTDTPLPKCKQPVGPPPKGCCCINGKGEAGITQVDCCGVNGLSCAGPSAERAWAASCGGIKCPQMGCCCDGSVQTYETKAQCVLEVGNVWLGSGKCVDSGGKCDGTSPVQPASKTCCCAPDGTMTQGLSESACKATGPGYLWSDKTDCADKPCVQRGCCCTETGPPRNFVTQMACQGANPHDSQWFSGQSCSETDCAQYGCCCVDGVGTPDSTKPLCDAAGGTFHYGDEDCSTTNCADTVTGACCVDDGSCVDGVTVQDCGGAFSANQTCAQVGCQEVSCCCPADGSPSSVITQAACTALNGYWNAGDYDCSQTNCENGCCCDGSQQDESYASCYASTSSASAWDPNDAHCSSCASIGCCCDPDFGCDPHTNSADCASSGGTWQDDPNCTQCGTSYCLAPPPAPVLSGVVAGDTDIAFNYALGTSSQTASSLLVEYQDPSTSSGTDTMTWNSTTSLFQGSFTLINNTGATSQVTLAYYTASGTYVGVVVDSVPAGVSTVTDTQFNAGLSPEPAPGGYISCTWMAGSSNYTLTSTGFSSLVIDSGGNVTASSGGWTTYSTVQNPSSSGPLDITGLDEDTLYYVQVQAVYASGTVTSVPVSATTGEPPPPAPSAPTTFCVINNYSTSGHGINSGISFMIGTAWATTCLIESGIGPSAQTVTVPASVQPSWIAGAQFALTVVDPGSTCPSSGSPCLGVGTLCSQWSAVGQAPPTTIPSASWDTITIASSGAITFSTTGGACTNSAPPTWAPSAPVVNGVIISTLSEDQGLYITWYPSEVASPPSTYYSLQVVGPSAGYGWGNTQIPVTQTSQLISGVPYATEFTVTMTAISGELSSPATVITVGPTLQSCSEASDCPSGADACGRYNSFGSDAQLMCCPSGKLTSASCWGYAYCSDQPTGATCACDGCCASGNCSNSGYEAGTCQ